MDPMVPSRIEAVQLKVPSMVVDPLEVASMVLEEAFEVPSSMVLELEEASLEPFRLVVKNTEEPC
jgi:hypothetical protein